MNRYLKWFNSMVNSQSIDRRQTFFCCNISNIIASKWLVVLFSFFYFLLFSKKKKHFLLTFLNRCFQFNMIENIKPFNPKTILNLFDSNKLIQFYDNKSDIWIGTILNNGKLSELLLLELHSTLTSIHLVILTGESLIFRQIFNDRKSATTNFLTPSGFVGLNFEHLWFPFFIEQKNGKFSFRIPVFTYFLKHFRCKIKNEGCFHFVYESTKF